jgi:hypothetical protein
MNSIIQRLKITKNVLYVLVLQFLSLSKNAWTICSFKKHCIWIGNHYRHLMISPHTTDISLPKNETIENVHAENLLNCWCYSDRKLGYWRYSLMRFTKPGFFMNHLPLGHWFTPLNVVTNSGDHWDSSCFHISKDTAESLLRAVVDTTDSNWHC